MTVAIPTNDSGLPRPRVVEKGVPWRKTFLRGHLAKELNDSGEILVLGDLRRHGPITPRHFFFGDPPYNLYQPIRIRPLDEENAEFVDAFREKEELTRTHGETASQPGIFDLTALLQILRIRDGDRRSVLLEARSGAGKTVAGRAALFDCLLAPQGEKPRLGELLPCVLRDFPGDGSILTAIAQASKSGKEPPSIGRVEEWLRSGPPSCCCSISTPSRRSSAGRWRTA